MPPFRALSTVHHRPSRGRVRQHHGWLSRQGPVPKSHVDYHNRARGDPVPQHPCAYSDGRDPLLNPLLTCPKGSDGEQRGQAEPYCLSRRTNPLPPSTSTTSPSWEGEVSENSVGKTLFRVCRRPVVGASLKQDSKWKSRLTLRAMLSS